MSDGVRVQRCRFVHGIQRLIPPPGSPHCPTAYRPGLSVSRLGRKHPVKFKHGSIVVKINPVVVEAEHQTHFRCMRVEGASASYCRPGGGCVLWISAQVPKTAEMNLRQHGPCADEVRVQFNSKARGGDGLFKHIFTKVRVTFLEKFCVQISFVRRKIVGRATVEPGLFGGRQR